MALVVGLSLISWSSLDAKEKKIGHSKEKNNGHAKVSKIGTRLQEVLKSFESDDEDKLPAIVSEIQIPVIVHFAGRPDLERIGKEENDEDRRHERVIRELQWESELSQQDLKPLLSWVGASELKDLWLINGLAVKLPPWLIEYLAKYHDEVTSITLDYTITSPGAGQGTQGPPEWNLTAIGAPDLWGMGITGEGIVVANMDTGVDMSDPAIAAAWRGGSNSWFDPNCPPPEGLNVTCTKADYTQPRDKAGGASGHGTGTMSIMVGGNDDNGNAIGVAPDAQWIAVKLFDDAGNAPVSSVHRGFQWLLDPDGDPTTNDAPDIVNNSWALSGTATGQCLLKYEADIQALKAAGIAVVFAAGNNGTGNNANTSVSPANNPSSYAVGAIDQFDILAGFSSRGPGPLGTKCAHGVFPELVAPGVNVRMATKSSFLIPQYINGSGTSFAAPHVAGAMALLLSADPNLSVGQLEAILAQSARDQVEPFDIAGPDNTYGNGVLDVAAAYQWLVTDTDRDGVLDAYDNCVNAFNPDQRDTNGDGFGNMCDFDLNNDGITNTMDLFLLRRAYLTSNADANFDGRGLVSDRDLFLFQKGFLKPPGPSGWVLP